MKFRYLMLFVLVFSIGVKAEQSSDGQWIIKGNIEELSEQVHTLQLEVNRLNEMISQVEQNAKIAESELKSDLSEFEGAREEQISHITNSLERTDNRIDSAEESIKEISVAWAQSSNIAKVGAIVLLTGLLIEIVGATVLAGTHLVTEQKEVYTLKSTPPSKDLSMTDVNSEPRINFLGSIASFTLFLGFVLQFSGTILVLSLPLWLTTILVALAIIPGTLVAYYLLGQSYNQSRLQKIKIILKNIKRNLTLSCSAKCEICSRSLNFNESYVYWSNEPNSEGYPYLRGPYNMHLGHQGCLESSGKYKQPSNRNSELPEIEQHRKFVADFLIEDVPEMKKWWRECRSHWADRRNSEESICFDEYAFLQLLKEINKLKPSKNLRCDHRSAPSSLQDGA